MARGRRQAEWGRTAEVLAMLWNVNAVPDARKDAAFFNPYAPKVSSDPTARPTYLGKMTLRELYAAMFHEQPIPAPKRKPQPDEG